MKIKLLFIMNHMQCGGAEKSLLSLLQTIDYSRYTVDLLLFSRKGSFLNSIPSEVRILSEPENYQYFDMSIKKVLVHCLKTKNSKLMWARLKASYIYRTEKNKARCEQRAWKYLSSMLPELREEYDVAIGYLEKNPIYYCIEKVKAGKKVGFIHTDYDKLGMDAHIDFPYFTWIDEIVTVSDECAHILMTRFPPFREKIKVMHNIISAKAIQRLAKEPLSLKKKGIVLVSVGRLVQLKGFDMAVEACKLLKEQGLSPKWYVLGEGEEREQLERLIEQHQLQDCFLLMGMQDNPYPYMELADIFVHCSRYEGKSIVIDEAKILNKPIVVTDYNTAKDQIHHEHNGLIVRMNSKAIAEGIMRFIHDEELRSNVIHQLSIEVNDTEDEIHKLYTLIAG